MPYRIKQINESTFIPQFRLWFWFEWGNIDKKDDYVWYNTETWSICPSYDSAYQTILKYKTVRKEKKQYPKYYKL